MASVIHTSNVTKQFGDTVAVRDVTLSIPEGQIVGFVGPNGAGKTTLISLLLGFLHASKGTVKLFGQPLTPATAFRSHQRIGYVAGDMTMFASLTGAQYLSFMSHRYGIDQKVRERLESKLSPQLDKKIEHLSRGNKQKIGLIAALQHDPDLIVMDEPTSGLDPLVQEMFLAIVKEEASRGATVFMSSHILSEVAAVCDRVLFMKRGRIVSDKTILELNQNAGKLVRLETEGNTEADMRSLLASLPKEAVVVEQTPQTLSLRFDDDIHIILRWLATKKFQDITIEDRHLDDLFGDLYKDEAVTIS